MLLPLVFLVAPVARCFLAPAPRVSVSRLSGAASDSEADVSSLRAQLERSLLASADAAADLGGGRAEEALGGGDRAVAMSGTARRRRATERGLVERLGAARDADEFSAAVDALWRLWFSERGAANREALEAVDVLIGGGEEKWGAAAEACRALVADDPSWAEGLNRLATLRAPRGGTPRDDSFQRRRGWTPSFQRTARVPPEDAPRERRPPVRPSARRIERKTTDEDGRPREGARGHLVRRGARASPACRPGYLQGDYAESRRLCERVLEMKPHHFGALAGICMCHAKLGDEDALAYWRARTLPTDPEARLRWATRVLKAFDRQESGYSPRPPREAE